MLSNLQKSLLKRGQRQAALPDQEYRAALKLVAGVNSSTDPAMTDRDLDKLMAYFEAIYWRKVATGECDNPEKLVRGGLKRQWIPFLAPDYWKNKNSKAENSRERFVAGNLAEEVTALENELFKMGFNTAYVAAIRRRVTGGRGTARDALNYKGALERTLTAKQAKLVDQPF